MVYAFTEEHRKHLSESHKGQIPWCKNKKMSLSTRLKMSNSHKGKQLSQKHKENLSLSHRGERNGFYGKHHTKESKQKVRYKNKNYKWTESQRQKIIMKNTGKKRSLEFRINASLNKLREKNPNWKGGTSYLPYCPKFNETLKRDIREMYDNKCILCGRNDKDNITLTGKHYKLSIHHIFFDKQEGCNGNEFRLVPLCLYCHNKIGLYNMKYYTEYILFIQKLYNINPLFKDTFNQ